MAAASNSQDDPQLQQQNQNIRVALSDAYAAVQGDATSQTFNAISFEELANAQILAINGPDTQSRPNQLDAIQQVVQNLTTAVQQIMSAPPDKFLEPDESRDVNTPP
jgi:hypothetical protein